MIKRALLTVTLALVACTLALGACTPAAEQPPPAALPDETPAARSARSVPEASEHVKAAEQKIAGNDAAGAKELLERAISENPDDARAHLDLGIANEMLENAAGAKTSYRKAIELAPDLAEALNNLGVLLRDEGSLDEAVALLQRAARSNAGSANVQLNLALALEDKGDAAGAERAYRTALEIDPDQLMTRVNLGLLLVDSGKAEAGAVELRNTTSLAQGNRPALLAIGNGLRRAGDAKGALAAMQAAVDSGGDPTPAVLAELALAQRAAQDRDGAIATLERALKLDAKYATAHYLLGNMLAGDKAFDKAKKHYEQYLKLEPKGEHAERAKERLAQLKKAK
jgi:Flp pilus assembly protein TadD